MAAQGSFLIFLAMVVLFAWLMNRWEKELHDQGDDMPSSSK
jgi:putative solute:sodium symporter small subunit